MRLYVSHSASQGPAGGDPDWFIVEPRDHPDDQVASLLAARRTVYALDAQPFAGQLVTYAGQVVAARTWLYGLTADEWFHLASEGGGSEVKPCCGNLGELRAALRSLAMFQSPDDAGWRLSIGAHILDLVDGRTGRARPARQGRLPATAPGAGRHPRAARPGRRYRGPRAAWRRRLTGSPRATGTRTRAS